MMKVLLILLIFITSVLSVHRSGGARKRTATQPTPSVADIPPEQRSRAEWESMELEALQLEAMNRRLIQTGSHSQLINRLWNFYHPNATKVSAPDVVHVSVSTSTISTNTSTAVSPLVSNAMPQNNNVIDIWAVVASEVRCLLGASAHNVNAGSANNLVNVPSPALSGNINTASANNLVNTPGPVLDNNGMNLNILSDIPGPSSGNAGINLSRPGPSGLGASNRFSGLSGPEAGAPFFPSPPSAGDSSLPAIPKSALDKTKK